MKQRRYNKRLQALIDNTGSEKWRNTNYIPLGDIKITQVAFRYWNGGKNKRYLYPRSTGGVSLSYWPSTDKFFLTLALTLGEPGSKPYRTITIKTHLPQEPLVRLLALRQKLRPVQADRRTELDCLDLGEVENLIRHLNNDTNTR